MTETKTCEGIANKQGRSFKELSASDVFEAIAYARKNGNLEDSIISIRDDGNRFNEMLCISYEYNEGDVQECISIQEPGNPCREIPILNPDSSGFNYKGLDRRLKAIQKKFGTVTMYIDMPYLRKREIEQLNNLEKKPANKKSIGK